MKQYDVHRGENERLLIFLRITLILTAILLAGLAWRQFISNQKFQQIERRQTERRILKPGPRGDIYDRKGNILVANRPHYSAVVYPDDLRPAFRRAYSEHIREERARLLKEYNNAPEAERPPDLPLPDYEKLKWDSRKEVIQKHLDRISRITGREKSISRNTLIRHFSEQLLLPLPLVKDLTPEEYALLIERIPVDSPIEIHTSTARHYPHDSTAAHVLGYVQRTDPDPEEIPDDGIKTFTFKTKEGRTGLEKTFNERLSGKTGSEIWRVDPLGFQESRLEMVPPEQGQDLITSIDLELQKAAERGLGDRTGAAVALDVQTGEVLAIASHPNYDLNELSPNISRKTFNEIEAKGAWPNRALQLSYPPGSTFKLITAIAGLRNGSITEATRHECRGIFRVGNRIFRCHARNGHGNLDLEGAIEGSCNVFFYDEGMRLGIDRLSAEAKRFGLNEKTGIEVPSETSRLVVPTRSWKRDNNLGGWSPGDTANTAIGQGYLLVTPLQMATVAASIARGETRTRPTLLALSPKEAGEVDHGGEPIGLDPEQRNMLLEGMQRVVGPDGTGRLVQIEGFPIAGKTGTADFRAHGKSVNLAWFIGFAPVDNPRIAVAVMLRGIRANEGYHGGSTAGPVAKDIFEAFRKRLRE